jgi:predicted RNase H-like HicB family nuclease
MKKDVSIYPAILTQYKDNLGIVFPDLPGCVSNADNIDEAISVARKVLELHLLGMEESKQELPKPSFIDKIKLDEYDIPLLVDAHMNY